MNFPNLEKLYSQVQWRDELKDAAVRYKEVVPALYDAVSKRIESKIDRPLIAISHMAYGWMPRMLGDPTPASVNEQGTVIVNQARSIQTPESAYNWLRSEKCALLLPGNATIQPAVNRSWVGTSKVLHLISPNAFPIWDSVVASCFELDSRWDIEKHDNFVNYVDFVSKNVGSDAVRKFTEAYEKEMCHKPSPVRAVEYFLYCVGKGSKRESG